jgi:hypothetical protein
MHMGNFLTAAVLSVAMLGGAAAAEGPPPSSDGKPYHLVHGIKFSKGYYYKGKNHSHWSHQYHWSKYDTMAYFDPGLQTWYYYAEDRDAYLPVSLIKVAPPEDESGDEQEADEPDPSGGDDNGDEADDGGGGGGGDDDGDDDGGDDDDGNQPENCGDPRGNMIRRR